MERLGILGRYFRRGLSHLIHKLLEILKPRCRNDDVIAPAADILGDAEETSARILLQGEDEGLPFDLDLGRLEGVLRNGRFRGAVGAVTLRTVTIR